MPVECAVLIQRPTRPGAARRVPFENYDVVEARPVGTRWPAAYRRKPYRIVILPDNAPGVTEIVAKLRAKARKTPWPVVMYPFREVEQVERPDPDDGPTVRMTRRTNIELDFRHLPARWLTDVEGEPITLPRGRVRRKQAQVIRGNLRH
jgi:hypothetical protein